MYDLHISSYVLSLVTIPVLHAIATCFGTYYMLAFGYEKDWSKIIARMLVLNFVFAFVLLPFMRPVRASAVTTVLTDLFSAGSSLFFYRRTASSASGAETAMLATGQPVV